MIKTRGIYRWLVASGLAWATFVAHADVFEVSAEQWARPRSGERIVAFATLQNLVNRLDERVSTVVTIRYAGGDEGLLWAEELRGWLVALGIPGDRIRLRTGSQVRDRLVLETE